MAPGLDGLSLRTITVYSVDVSPFSECFFFSVTISCLLLSLEVGLVLKLAHPPPSDRNWSALIQWSELLLKLRARESSKMRQRTESLLPPVLQSWEPHNG